MIKTLFAAFLLLCAAASCAHADTPGRFQLFQGEYLFTNIRGEAFWQRGLFKLDTVTGELFECRSTQFDGKLSSKPGMLIQKTECRPFEGEISVPNQS
jgi:hypothetical protein